MLCVNEKCRESSIGLEIVDFLKFPRILNILLIFLFLFPKKHYFALVSKQNTTKFNH